MMNKKRVNINFSDEVLENLTELSQNSTMSDIIRKSIALFKWAKDIKKEGGRILVERNGKVREVEIIL